MICPNCSALVEDNASFCPWCGKPFAETAQNEPVKKAIGKTICSKLFLAYAIFISVFTAALLAVPVVLFIKRTVSALSMLPIRSAVSVLPFIAIPICAIVSTVGVWKLYAGKDRIEVKNLRLAKTLMTALYVISIIAFVCFCIGIVVILVTLILSGIQSTGVDINAAVSEIEQSQNYDPPRSFGSEINVTAILIILLVLLVFGVVYLAFSIRVYGKSSKYWGALVNAAQTGSYDVASAPTVLLFVWAIITGLGAAPSFFVPGFAMPLISGATAGLLITQGLLFRRIHEEISRAKAQTAKGDVSFR